MSGDAKVRAQEALHEAEEMALKAEEELSKDAKIAAKFAAEEAEEMKRKLAEEVRRSPLARCSLPNRVPAFPLASLVSLAPPRMRGSCSGRAAGG